MSRLDEQRKLVEALRVEASVKPIKVSAALQDMIAFIQANEKTDVLASGFTTVNDNPYKEKAGCLVS
jgi:hypothetical protein